MTGKAKIRLLAVVLAVLMPLSTALVIAAESEESGDTTGVIKYESPDINEISGMGKEPEELSVTAGATYREKAWYEYVTYSDKAVCSYRLDDEQRLLFYDPYTYTNAMIMDVQFDATTTEFDTMSEYTISKTKSKTISHFDESTYTSLNETTKVDGKDETHSDVTNSGKQTTKYNHSVTNSTSGTKSEITNYEYKDLSDFSETITIGFKGLEEVVESATEIGTTWVTDKVTNTTKYSKDYKTTTTEKGTDVMEDQTKSTTDGWTTFADRITKSTGSSSVTNDGWSEEEGTTTTKTYAATHFATDGVTPLPWAIVHYTVQMPMKCCRQYLVSGEWMTVSTEYCLLTTISGTCRAWMQNGQVYYEDWGSGEPVVETDFWSNFMTRERLIKAYESRLYPTGGND